MQAAEADIDLVVMVEPGKLEWQFVICVSSLLAHCHDRFRLHAFCRSAKVKELSKPLLVFCKRWNIEIRHFDSPFADGYPQGNKIMACAQIQNSGRVVFLDTDTGLMRPTRFMSALQVGSIGFVPAREKTWTEDIADWRRLFAAFDMDLPRHRVQLGFGGIWVPYANGGVVIYDIPGFGAQWLETALRIDQLSGFPSFRPWLDQVALTVAIYRQNHALEILDMIWNDTPMFYSKQSIVMHYHNVTWMQQYKINHILRETLQHHSDFVSIGALIQAVG